MATRKAALTGRQQLIVFVVGIIFSVIVIAIATHHGSSAASGSASYTAAISSTDVINPATINVIVNVTNNGTTTGTPDCTVHLTDPGGAYTGFDDFTLNPLASGASTAFNGNIVVTHEGAQYVSAAASSVTCT